MTNNDPIFHETLLWQYWDNLASQNNLTISSFTMEDEWKINEPRIKITVSNYKRRMNENFTMSHEDVYLFCRKSKALLADTNMVGDVEASQKSFTLENRKKLRVTVMKKNEYGVCIRMAFGDAKSTYADQEKIYASLDTYQSILLLLNDFISNFATIAINQTLSIRLSKISESQSDFLKYMKMMDSRKRYESNPDSQPPIQSNKYTELPSGCIEEKTPADIKVTPPSVPEVDGVMTLTTTEDAEAALDEMDQNQDQLDLDKFISEQKDSIDIKIPNEVINDSKVVPEIEMLKDNGLISEVFDNNLINFEQIVMSCLSVEAPLHNFCDVALKKMNLERSDLMPNCSDSDYASLLYCTSRYIKYFINKHLTTSTDLPSSVLPMSYTSKGISDINISIMYDLFLLFVYYTQLHNQLKDHDYDSTNNKSVLCFAMKAMLSPLVFSFFSRDASKEVVISEIRNRYTQYQKKGIFIEVEKNIKSVQTESFSVAPSSIQEVASKIYDAAIEKLNSFNVSVIHKNLHSKHLVKIAPGILQTNILSPEQINVVLSLESNYNSNGIVDFNQLDITDKGIQTLPAEVLKVFNIEVRKPDNGNLKRFVKETMKDSKHLDGALQIANLMTTNIYDLKDKDVSFINLPEEVLKAFCLWDLDKNPEFQTRYTTFKTAVIESTLEKSSALSLLIDIGQPQEEDIMNSLRVATDN